MEPLLAGDFADDEGDTAVAAAAAAAATPWSRVSSCRRCISVIALHSAASMD